MHVGKNVNWFSSVLGGFCLSKGIRESGNLVEFSLNNELCISTI